MDENLNWYLVYSKPRHELKLAQRVSDMGIETYCPTIRTVRQWSDRKKKVIEPLFKSYVFVRLNEFNRESIYHVSGFSRFVFWLGKPAVVREQEINTLKNFMNKVVHETIALKRFEVGQHVRVQSGPLKDNEGTLLRIKGQEATLQMDSLGTVIQAKIALADLAN